MGLQGCDWERSCSCDSNAMALTSPRMVDDSRCIKQTLEKLGKSWRRLLN